jgi:predicted RNA polymerase sigma factor
VDGQSAVIESRVKIESRAPKWRANKHARYTDSGQILGLYGLLEQMTVNQLVSLKCVVAAAVQGPRAGLDWLVLLDDWLACRYFRLAVVRVYLLEGRRTGPARLKATYPLCRGPHQ